jgi:hypothetical protein
MSLILALLSFAGNTQTSNPDTTCLPVPDAQKVLKAAKDGKIYHAERDSAFELIKVMDGRINSKDSTIQNLIISTISKDLLIATYKKESANLVDQRDKQKLDTYYYENLYRRQRTKSAITGIAGIAGIVAILFLKK